MSSNQPAHETRYEPADKKQRNFGHYPSRLRREPVLTNVRTTLIEPPMQEVFLLEPRLGNGMKNDCRWLIEELLPSIQQCLAKFGVLIANFTAGAGTEVCAETSVGVKDRTRKTPVEATRSKTGAEETKKTLSYSLFDLSLRPRASR